MFGFFLQKGLFILHSLGERGSQSPLGFMESVRNLKLYPLDVTDLIPAGGQVLVECLAIFFQIIIIAVLAADLLL